MGRGYENKKGGKEMTCFFCKGDMADSTTTFTATLENTIVIIKNVPCYKCKQCGEVSYSFDVTQRLEKIIDSFKESLSEISVVNYSAA